MGLFAQITDILTNDLAEYLADHFGIDAIEVGFKINDYLEQNCKAVYNNKKQLVQKQENSLKQKRTEINYKPAVVNIKCCKFKITRGNKEGLVCGTVVRSGGDYCSKHKNRKIAKKSSNSSISDNSDYDD
jgi:hypothetical protein